MPVSEFMDRVNETKVTGALLGEVVRLHANMPPEDRPDFEARAIRMFELLDKKGLREERGVLASAIDFRLTALAKLQGDPALRAWTMAGKDEGADYIHADLLEAAAAEPLVEDQQGQASFDPNSFRRRVLSITETKGSA